MFQLGYFIYFTAACLLQLILCVAAIILGAGTSSFSEADKKQEFKIISVSLSLAVVLGFCFIIASLCKHARKTNQLMERSSADKRQEIKKIFIVSL